MMNVEQSMGCFVVETEILGKNLPQFPLIHNKSDMTSPGLEPGPPRWEAGD
jgi:hypothetical protein